MKRLKKASVLILTAIIAAAAMLCFGAGTASAADAGKTYNVMIINFDPIFTVNGQTLKQHELLSHWNDPYTLADQFAEDMSEISYNYVNYRIAETIELDEMPRSTEINQAPYTTDEYYETLMTAIRETDGAYWKYKGWKDYKFTFDYDYYFTKYNVYDKVNNGTIDEVWFFGGPVTGVTMHETIMVGKDAFWVNGKPLVKNCRNFVAYGFNYERGVGEMLEDAGHRQESIMNNLFGTPNYNKDYAEFNEWEKFTAYDKVAPGKSGVGNVHWAPNSTGDYDWGNTRYVSSSCANWINYPDLSGEAHNYNCSEWGDGDIRLHHKWWFKHLPHAVGKNAETGFYNNWWIYFTLDYLNCPPAAKYHIGTCSFSSIANAAYTGSAFEPDVTVKHGSKTLKSGTDYSISYKDNVNAGTASVTVQGIGEYCGTITKYFTIAPAEIDSVTLSKTSFSYTGKQVKVGSYIKVRSGDTKLKYGTDFTMTYADNVNCGVRTASVTVQGIGNYTGTVTKYYTILPKQQAAPKLSTKSGRLHIVWTKDPNAQGYQIQYCQNSSFTGDTLHSASFAADKTSTSLKTYPKAGETWYVRVRATVQSSSGAKYGTWSNAKSLTLGTIDNVTLSKTEFAYTGKAVKVGSYIKVRSGDTALKYDVDFTLAYANNVSKGTAAVTVIGIGEYSGSSVTKEYQIK